MSVQRTFLVALNRRQITKNRAFPPKIFFAELCPDPSDVHSQFFAAPDVHFQARDAPDLQVQLGGRSLEGRGREAESSAFGLLATDTG